MYEIKLLYFLKLILKKYIFADTENRTQVSDLQDQCINHYTIPAYYIITLSLNHFYLNVSIDFINPCLIFSIFGLLTGLHIDKHCSKVVFLFNKSKSFLLKFTSKTE